MKLSRNTPLVLLTLFALALVPRVYDLDGTAFWYDESISMLEAIHLDNPTVRHFAFLEGPVQTLLVYPLVRLTRHEFWLRLPYAIWGALFVPMLYVLGKKIFDHATGLTAAVLAAINPLSIHFSREARGYTLGAFLAALCFLGLMNLFQQGRRRDWIVYGGTLVVLIYINALYFSIWILGNVLFMGALLTKGWSTQTKLPPRFAVKWILFQLLVFLLIVPRIIGNIDHASNSGLNSWMPFIELHQLSNMLAATTLGYHAPLMLRGTPWSESGIATFLAFWIPLVALIGVLIFAMWKSRHNHWGVSALAMSLLPMIGLAMFSLVLGNVFIVRYIVFFYAPLLVVLAYGWVSLLRASRMSGIAFALVFACLTARAIQPVLQNAEVPAVEAHTKYDYRLLVDYIDKENRRLGLNADNSVVLHYSKASLSPFVYYSEALWTNRGVTFPLPECETSNTDNDVLKEYMEALEIHSIGFNEAIKGKKYGWVLFSRWSPSKRLYNYLDHQKKFDRLPDEAAEQWLIKRYGQSIPLSDAEPGEPYRFNDFIRLYLFALPSAPPAD